MSPERRVAKLEEGHCSKMTSVNGLPVPSPGWDCALIRSMILV